MKTLEKIERILSRAVMASIVTFMLSSGFAVTTGNVWLMRVSFAAYGVIFAAWVVFGVLIIGRK